MLNKSARAVRPAYFRPELTSGARKGAVLLPVKFGALK